jgi:antigen flippase
MSSVYNLPEPAESEEPTYGHILKSTALVGGTAVVNIAIGVVRTKAMAILLGPAGFGLFGLYGSLSNLAQTITGIGINSSGVRQIAAAAGSADGPRVATAVIVLRRVAIILGVLGGGLLAIFARPVSSVTFGNEQHTTAIYILSIAVFFNSVCAGQGALIQGMRRISDMAKIGILSGIGASVISIAIIYFFRARGIALSLGAVAFVSLLTSWWYSRKIPIDTPSLTFSEIGREASALLRLGLAFLVSDLLMMGSAYAVRIVILHKLGLNATGLYSAAWTLGGMYVGMITQAMGADFYPRLSGVINSHSRCNRLVNEQARVGLLLAGPGVIGTLTFAPVVLSIFYGAKFGAAVELLRWICLGIAMRMISWPMGFIIMAKGRQHLIVFCELTWTAVYLCLAVICLNVFGLKGVGIAFFGSYIFHIALTYVVVRRLTGFSWSAENKEMSALYACVLAAVFYSLLALPWQWAIGIGTVAAVTMSVYSIQIILTLVSVGRTSAVSTIIQSGSE